MSGEPDLASATIGKTALDTFTLYDWTQFAKGVGIQFGMREAFIAGKAATAHTFRQYHAG